MKTKRLFIISLVILCSLSWSTTDAAAKYDPLVRQGQKRLRELGYDPGPADGKMGKRTENAIKNFQRDNMLPVTGKLDNATRQQLGIRSKGPLFLVGGKLWYADVDVPKYAGEEVEIDPGFTWGPIASISFANNWWASGMFLTGGHGYAQVRDYYLDWYEAGGDFSSQEAEIVIGHSFSFFDIGGGFKYTKWEWESKAKGEENPDITTYGPMLYLGASPTVAKISTLGGAIGGYLEASWVFAELGDEEDTQHMNFEGGIFFIKERFKGSFGYRYKNYYKLYENYVGFDGDSLTFKGIVGSLSYLF